jgi:hypothetical protein
MIIIYRCKFISQSDFFRDYYINCLYIYSKKKKMYNGFRNSTLSLSSLFIKQYKQNVFPKRVQTQIRFSRVTSGWFTYFFFNNY